MTGALGRAAGRGAATPPRGRCARRSARSPRRVEHHATCGSAGPSVTNLRRRPDRSGCICGRRWPTRCRVADDLSESALAAATLWSWTPTHQPARSPRDTPRGVLRGRRPRCPRRRPAPTRRAARSRRRTAGCARRSSATATGSCTAKAFRRLKHKTQVFVAPRGRPLPHAADAHAGGHADLAHRGAGAAPQRGPGGGDRPRSRPRPPAVRPHRRGRARRLPARALRARASATTSTRCGSSTSELEAGSTSPSRCATASSPLGPRARARDARRARIVRIVDRVAYINHDIDDALRAGVARAADLPDGADRGARRHGLAAHRHAGPRPRRALAIAPGTSCRARRSARRWRRCATSCSSDVYLGRRRAREHANASSASSRRSSTTSSSTPSCCPTVAARRARRSRSA